LVPISGRTPFHAWCEFQSSLNVQAERNRTEVLESATVPGTIIESPRFQVFYSMR
jgi:hypothetical protein